MTAIISVYAFVSCETKSNFKGKDEYKRLLASPIQGLMDKGKAYFDAGKPDSSYLMYAAVSSRYSPSMSREEKSICEMACNNAAYISHVYYHDYPQACALLLKGLAITEEIGAKNAYPFIYVNLGNLMYASGNWKESMAYQIKAINSAIEVADTSNYLKGATNLFSEALINNKVEDYRKEVDEFPRLRSSGDLWNFTEKLHKIAKAKLAGDDAEVDRTLKLLCEEDHSGIEEDSVRLVFFPQFILAKTEEQRGHHRKALNVLKGMESRGLQNAELASYLYEALSTNYRALGMADSAAEYRLRFAELTDTLRSDQKQNSIYDMRRTYENRAINFRMEGLMQERETLVRTVWIVSGFSALVLLLLVCVIISRRKTLKAKREIYARNQELLREMDAHRAVPLNPEPAEPKDEQEHPAARSTTTDSEPVDEELLQKVKEIMETSPEVYSSDFSVERLAAVLGLPVRKVSKTINDGLGQNFSTTLQTYRIREACRRLSDTETYAHLTIEAIAESLGFKSRSNFNTVFKKITGLTPAAWQKIARGK